MIFVFWDDMILTGKLLHELRSHSQKQTSQCARSCTGSSALLSSDQVANANLVLALVGCGIFDFLELGLNIWVVDGRALDIGEDELSVVDTILDDEPTR